MKSQINPEKLINAGRALKTIGNRLLILLFLNFILAFLFKNSNDPKEIWNIALASMIISFIFLFP